MVLCVQESRVYWYSWTMELNSSWLAASKLRRQNHKKEYIFSIAMDKSVWLYAIRCLDHGSHTLRTSLIWGCWLFWISINWVQVSCFLCNSGSMHLDNLSSSCLLFCSLPCWFQEIEAQLIRYTGKMIPAQLSSQDPKSQDREMLVRYNP